jgi:hypothetical protein
MGNAAGVVQHVTAPAQSFALQNAVPLAGIVQQVTAPARGVVQHVTGISAGIIQHAAGTVQQVIPVDFTPQKSLHEMGDYSLMDTYLNERIAVGSPAEKKIAKQIKLLKTEIYSCFDCNDVGYTYKDRDGMVANLDGRGNYDIYKCVKCSSGNNLGPVGFNPTDKCARIVKSGVRGRGFFERIVTFDFNLVETALDNNLLKDLSVTIATNIRADLERKDSLMSFLLPLINPLHRVSKEDKEDVVCGLIAQIIMKPAMVTDAAKYLNMDGAEGMMPMPGCLSSSFFLMYKFLSSRLLTI